MKYRILFFVTLATLCISCKDEVLPKPKAMLRLDYPTAEYMETGSDCVYTFDKNTLSEIKENKFGNLVLITFRSMVIFKQ